MTAATVSVVVVSRDRPAALTVCLTAISQLQTDSPFEVIVVADVAGVAAVNQLPFAAKLKIVGFDEPNISAARNLGIRQASGEILAFIDDDAVPEPSWLHHLCAVFVEPRVAAAGGYVRGRNGISYQWRGQMLDARGMAHPLEIDPARPTLLTPPAGHAVKTEGTNMAVRRCVLVALGGFDEAFHYFLDETELNMRLARAGHATAIVPKAEVHHGFAANRLRGSDRAPRDLFDIGASWAVFQRRHVPEQHRAGHWADLRNAERRRVLELMVSGRLQPDDVRWLMLRLDLGYAEGRRRKIPVPSIPAAAELAFRPFEAVRRSGRVMSGRIWSNRRLTADAARRAADNQIVTMILLSPTVIFHRVRFVPEGYWLQRGGLFGKSDRTERFLALYSHRGRIFKETERVRGYRLA